MANRFWVNVLSSTWDATAGLKWSTTTGGVGGQASPIISDDVKFDANSSANTVTISATANCRSLICTGFTGTLAQAANLNIGDGTAGDFTLVAGMSFTYTSGTLFLKSTTTGNNVTTAGKTLGVFNVSGVGGGWTQTDALTCTTFTCTDGTYNATSKTITATSASFNGGTATIGTLVLTTTCAPAGGTVTFGSGGVSGGTTYAQTSSSTVTFGTTGFSGTTASLASSGGTLDMGSGTWSLSGTGTIWSASAAGNTFTGSSATIDQTDTSSSTKTFAGGGLTYGTLRIRGAASSGRVTMTGSNTFTTLRLDADATFRLTAGTTQTVTAFTATGTSGHPITIDTATGSATLSCANQVSCDWLVLTNCVATGGGNFYAGANSVDNGGNTGWIFTAPPPLPDKWTPKYPDKIWVSVHGEFGGKVFQPTGITASETVRPDKWLPVYPSIIYKAKPNVAIGCQVFPTGITAGETIRLDKWNPSYPSIIWKSAPKVPTGLQVFAVGITSAEASRIDKWQPKYPDIIWKAKSPVGVGIQVFDVGITTPEFIDPDKWDSKFQDIVWAAKRPLATGFQVFPEGIATTEVIYPDKWQPRYPDIIQRPVSAAEGLPSGLVAQEVLTPPEIVTCDKWQPRLEIPDRRRSAVILDGVFAPVSVEEAASEETGVGKGHHRYPRVYLFREQRVVVKDRAQEIEFLKYTRSELDKAPEVKAPKKSKRKERPFTLKTIPDAEFYDYTSPNFNAMSQGAVDFDAFNQLNANYAAHVQFMDDEAIIAILLVA